MVSKTGKTSEFEFPVEVVSQKNTFDYISNELADMPLAVIERVRQDEIVPQQPLYKDGYLLN